jgi:hypothetical protein
MCVLHDNLETEKRKVESIHMTFDKYRSNSICIVFLKRKKNPGVILVSMSSGVTEEEEEEEEEDWFKGALIIKLENRHYMYLPNDGRRCAFCNQDGLLEDEDGFLLPEETGNHVDAGTLSTTLPLRIIKPHRSEGAWFGNALLDMNDWVNRNDSKDARAWRSAKKRITEMRIFRDLYHPLMRPEDIPWIKLLNARYWELYCSIRGFQKYVMVVTVSIKLLFLRNYKRDVAPPWYMFFVTFPGMLCLGVMIFSILVTFEMITYFYMVTKRGHLHKEVGRERGKCAICLASMDVGAKQGKTGKRGGEKDKDSGNVTLHCGHSFHRKCISKWLEHKSNCPLCRKRV